MNIQISLLTTVNDCDSVLELLNAEKIQLERRVRNLGEMLENRNRITSDVKEQMESVKGVMEAYEAALAAVSDSKEQGRFELKIKQAAARLQSLENREANYNPVTLIEDQVDYSQLEVQIPILDDAIAQITAHKATLA